MYICLYWIGGEVLGESRTGFSPGWNRFRIVGIVYYWGSGSGGEFCWVLGGLSWNLRNRLLYWGGVSRGAMYLHIPKGIAELYVFTLEGAGITGAIFSPG